MNYKLKYGKIKANQRKEDFTLLLTIDIGNTNITLGGFEGDSLLFTARLATDCKRTSDQYAVELKQIIELNRFDGKMEGVIISSVVPVVTESLFYAMQKLYGVKPMVLGPGVKTGLNIKIDNPAQLGADLVAGAVGALQKYSLPCIVIDMGTATTLSVINKNGEFLGGAIAAGVGTTLDALTSRTTLLPSINVEAPKKAIGSNTAECMQSGLVFGTAAMIDGLIERFTEELAQKPTVVATGGRAKQVICYCKNDITVDDNLLLDGLYSIYKKNKA